MCSMMIIFSIENWSIGHDSVQIPKERRRVAVAAD